MPAELRGPGPPRGRPARRGRAALQDLLMEPPNPPDERSPAGGKEATRLSAPGAEAHLGQAPRPRGALQPTRVDPLRPGHKLGGTGTGSTPGRAPRWNGRCSISSAASTTPPGTSSAAPAPADRGGRVAARQFPKFDDDVFHIRERRRPELVPAPQPPRRPSSTSTGTRSSRLRLCRSRCSPTRPATAARPELPQRGARDHRGHQFNKAETFQSTAPEDTSPRSTSSSAQRDAVEKLQRHHQTSLLATRDASASMRPTYDIEVSLPSIGHPQDRKSVSFRGVVITQARRANIRYRPWQGRGPPRSTP